MNLVAQYFDIVDISHEMNQHFDYEYEKLRSVA